MIQPCLIYLHVISLVVPHLESGHDGVPETTARFRVRVCCRVLAEPPETFTAQTIFEVIRAIGCEHSPHLLHGPTAAGHHRPGVARVRPDRPDHVDHPAVVHLINHSSR